MSDFNYERAQLAALGAFSLRSRSLSTTSANELNENRSEIGSQQRFQRTPVQMELDLPVPNQLELSLKKGPK